MDDAKYRMQNKIWLSYSQKIAIRILSILADRDDLSKETLANSIGISEEQMTRIVKGHENLSLELIAKLSEALSTDLISFPSYAATTSQA